MTQLQALERKPAAEGQTNWVTAFFMAAFHIGAFAALFFFTWKAALVAIFLWWIRDSQSGLKTQAAIQKLETEECPWSLLSKVSE